MKATTKRKHLLKRMPTRPSNLPFRRFLTVSLIIAAAHTLGGCAVLGYYSQSTFGHLHLMFRSRPISEWLEDKNTDPVVRDRLQTVLDMRTFAIEQLHLPDNGSYLDYADLERSHVVWNVFATPEFSLKPVTSCFPFVGCLNYRGYFSQADAEVEAARLKALGHDVYVGGVAAYSTLGWFADPVLNTMLQWSEPRLASVLFHELGHQKLYVDDDSAFNEAFATAVGEIGVQRWFAEQDDSEVLRKWQAQRHYQEDFLQLVSDTAERLKTLYAVQAEEAVKRSAKLEILRDMQSRYAELKAKQWHNYSGYDAWFSDVNNARISAVSTYHAWVPAFLNILRARNYDLDAFYAECELGAALKPEQRRAWLESWLERGG